MHSQPIDINSLLVAIRLLEERGTQMRRMLKEAEHAVSGAGGPPSELHAAAGSGRRNLAVISRTTAPLWTTIT
jgi:hypothetical protein